ncbi:CPCC family cysteine-rich protein [Streptomyces sp. NPDC090077]|uniref:CPCC family cysteine-rich protein n=1 Tax=Streptomyces sp. NPDC090077 TaxID=3365938 RepID=UPI0037FA79E8
MRERRTGGPGEVFDCPCCFLPTLESSACFEICGECGWEDDGQDDGDADRVWGGPNGDQSLTDARREYREWAAEDPDESSVGRGGDGAWRTAAREVLRERGGDPEGPA